ncbi:MAG: hypothetical protein Q8M76_01900 [Spirochaetaceae bacterium]|nr:hypothetical protein [Spirochaetaceae bacterium]
MSSIGWRDEKRHEVFEGVLRSLETRKATDPSFTITDAEGSLTHLYHREGMDWEGRGELQDVILAATIAAHEHFIVEWKAEKER